MIWYVELCHYWFKKKNNGGGGGMRWMAIETVGVDGLLFFVFFSKEYTCTINWTLIALRRDS